MEQKRDYPVVPDIKLIFGDWCFATLRGIKHDVPRGKYIFVFVPDPFMIWAHQIQDSDYDEAYSVIKKEYDEEYCFCVNPDLMSQTWFLLCDYNGKKCNPVIRINQELLAKNKSLKAERDVYEISALLTPLKLKKMITYPEEAKSELLREMKEQKKIMGVEYPGEEKGGAGE